MYRSLRVRYGSLIFFVVLAHFLLLSTILYGQHSSVGALPSDVLMVQFRDINLRPSLKGSAISRSKADHSKPETSLEPLSQGVGLDGSKDALPLEGSSSRLKIYGPKPHYPLVSRRLREQGTVLMKLCVGSQGVVQKLEVLQSSGFKNLDGSAVSALSAWKFAAVAGNSGKTSEDCFRMPVHFSLEG